MKKLVNHYLTFNRLILSTIGIFGVFINLLAQNSQKPLAFQSLTTGTGIVINEIMADPTPVVGLPDTEWIELYNKGNFPVRLKDWKIAVGVNFKLLPDSVIPADQYAILCSAIAAPEMRKFGRTIALPSFPALRNSGNQIVLKDAGNVMVDSIDYSDRWYGVPAKKEGGWSLERIDPERTCGQALNWKASEDPSGGSPGRLNPVYQPNSDTTPPWITSTSVINPQKVEIRFSEWMNPLMIRNKMNYSLPSGFGNPDSIYLSDEKTVVLFWGKRLEGNITYRLKTANLTDLCGNLLNGNEADICLTILKEGDLLINEILFDPWPGGADFLEIWNKTKQSVPLDKIVVATRDVTGVLKSFVSFDHEGLMINPDGLMALTTDTISLKQLYFAREPQVVRQVSRLPAFNNDKGSVVLLSDSLTVLDELHYTSEMHHPLLLDPEGVSLERISPDKPAADPFNWHSAASAAGYATPGSTNSQYCPRRTGKTKITFLQTYISPNQDGVNDELVIQYETPAPGWMMTCHVFDASGRLYMILRNNMLSGISGEFSWNGRDEQDHQLPPGPCIVNFEMFNLSGEKENHKKVMVITK